MLSNVPSSAWISFVIWTGITAMVSAAPSGSGPPTRQQIAAGDFVSVDELKLKDQQGEVYLTGLNYWSCINLAADDKAGGNHSRFLTELDQMAAHGINHLRIMASSEGATTHQPFRMYPALMKAPGVYNEDIFVGLDRCLDEMSKRGMRATMTLSNEWQWSGGFAQYVSWANENSPIPYPSSWNLSAPPQRPTPGTGWGNYTTEGVNAAPYSEFTDFANRFYTIEKCQQWYHAHIEKVINRVNTVNGRKYSEDATIMTWQLANEPQSSGSLSSDPLIGWVKSTSEYIKSLAPKQLVSVGFEGKQGEAYWKAVHDFESVDYGTTHCWVQNWDIYDMLDPSRENLETAKTFAKDFVSNSSTWGKQIGKPVFLEEFGMARNNWENVDKEYLYLSSAGTSNKDEYFETIIGAAMDEFKSKDGSYIGTCPWAYGGIYRPETQHVNAFGEVWAGDPPHEAPGWYDLYDTDHAMDIIHRQQQDIAEYLGANSKQSR